VFSCALSPVVAAGVRKALEIAQREPELRDALWANVRHIRSRLDEAGVDVGDSTSQIVAIMVRNDRRVFEICHKLLGAGVYLQPVIYPAVAKHRSRFRVSISAAHTREQLDEGAAILILENRKHAEARGAPILGEIIGFGMSADATDIVLPSLEGAVRAMRACIEDSGLAPGAFEYVNAHGTGTAMNDVTETRAIHEVFGDHARRLAISSTKSLHGHALGAAGAIEAVATLLAMRQGFIPPTANYNEVDPQCDLDYVPNTTREQSFSVALSSSFAFGGLNAVLALRR